LTHLDGIRGLAIAGVLGFHTNLFHFGYLGVQVFFVVSGYLITTLIFKRPHTRQTLLTFYWDRFIRLTPVFWTSLLVGAIGYLAVYGKVPVSLIARAGLYLRNFYPTEGLVDHDIWVSSWSLASEQQFYLVAPIFWALIRKNGRILTLSPYTLMLVYFYLTIWLIPKSNFTVHFFMNSSGLVLGSYLALAAITRINSKISLTLLLLHLLISLLFGRIESVVEIVTAIFILTFNSKKAKFALRFFQNKLLVNLGIISYSIYLWHTLVFTVVGKYSIDVFNLQKISSVGFSIVLGYISYIFLEVPSRKFFSRIGKDRFKKHHQS